MGADHPPHVEDGDAVEHDRRDDLVGARASLQRARYRAVETTPDDAGGEDQDHCEESGDVGDPRPRADPGGGGCADEELAFDADVEQTGTERERNAERGADERRRPAERGRDPIWSEHASQQRPIRRDRVLADEEDHDPADRECEPDRGDRDEDRLQVEVPLHHAMQIAPRCLRSRRCRHQLAIALGSSLPQAMSRPTRSRVATARSYSPTSSPR